MRDSQLADALAAFAIDEGLPALPFAARLARENRWTGDFAARVVAEYLRFLYLAAITTDIVTPSNAVDQAWHLHLCYTRSYWHRLCRDLLGRELHHGPTRGGSAERTRYSDAYERTLALYRAEFGHAAPADIWPVSAVRFAPNASPVSVAPRDYFILSKVRLRRIALACGLLPLAGLTAGALAASGFPPVVFVPVLFGAVLAGVMIFTVLRRSRKGDGSRGDHRGSGCGTSCGGGGGCHSSHSGDSSSDGDSGGGDSGCGAGGGCGGGCGGGGD